MSETRSRVAVVTGAGRGMGRAIARGLAQRGDVVIAVSRTEADLAETVAGAVGRTKALCADVSQPRDVEALFAEVTRTFGGVDVLVCSHGTYAGGVGALDLSLDQFDATLRVNLHACLHCAQLAGCAMRDAGRGGRIVFISSMNAEASQIGAVDYDTSKAALNGLTRALAVELARYRITVNAIAPGWVQTSMSESELHELDRDGMVMNPLHRVGSPEDIALAALWLTDDANGYATGGVIPVDGGQRAMLPMPWPAGTDSLG
jgi:NAD(P)-dependent dehydrogenase (short-subunit alcohol dehydrogenase family)